MVNTKANPKNAALAGTIAFLLAAITFLLYASVLKFDFLNWDDQSYVTENDHVKGGLTPTGVTWAFVKSHSANWHPITWLSHMLDVSMFGMNPAGHHATNVVFHVANTVLLLLLLWQMTRSVWRSAMVAALFALHPLHVESVAWVAERKDVLSAFFGILTLMAYTYYVGESKVSGLKAKVWYAVTLGLFALGLMSKPMLVTWPFVMLLLDFWPLGRAGVADERWRMEGGKVWGKLVLEKIPFFALAIGSCAVTLIAQKQGGAVASVESLPISYRLQNAAIAYTEYLAKFFWPVNLSPIYPHPAQWETWKVVGSVVVLVGLSALAWFGRRRFPYGVAGWFWFLGTLVPVIGIVQVGSQAFADRYTYLPQIGLVMLLVWLTAEVAGKLHLPKMISGTLTVAILATLSWRTMDQLIVWKNTETLFRHTLGLSPNNTQALNGLGGHYIKIGRIEEGKQLLEQVIQLEPTFVEARGSLADALDSEGRYREAIEQYEAALVLQPDNASLLNNLAWLRAACPDATIRNGDAAVRLATRACEITGYKKPLFVGTLAAAQAETGDFQAAIDTAEQAAKTAKTLGLIEITVRNHELLKLYSNGKAAHGERPKI